MFLQQGRRGKAFQVNRTALAEACVGRGCGPRKPGTQVCREIGQGELGHFTKVLLGWVKEFEDFSCFLFLCLPSPLFIPATESVVHKKEQTEVRRGGERGDDLFLGVSLFVIVA